MKKLIVTLAIVFLAGCGQPKKSDIDPKDQEIANLRQRIKSLETEVAYKRKVIEIKFNKQSEFLSTDVGFETMMTWAHEFITGRDGEKSYGDSAYEVCDDLAGDKPNVNHQNHLSPQVQLACNIVLHNDSW